MEQNGPSPLLWATHTDITHAGHAGRPQTLAKSIENPNYGLQPARGPRSPHQVPETQWRTSRSLGPLPSHARWEQGQDGRGVPARGLALSGLSHCSHRWARRCTRMDPGPRPHCSVPRNGRTNRPGQAPWDGCGPPCCRCQWAAPKSRPLGRCSAMVPGASTTALRSAARAAVPPARPLSLHLCGCA